MKELEKTELEGLVRFNQRVTPLYLYTPLCGTCKVTTRMLEVVEAALPNLELYKVNLNYASEWAREWQIESVPCLVFLEGRTVQKKVYAFKTVHDVYELLKPYSASGPTVAE